MWARNFLCNFQNAPTFDSNLGSSRDHSIAGRLSRVKCYVAVHTLVCVRWLPGISSVLLPKFSPCNRRQPQLSLSVRRQSFGYQHCLGLLSSGIEVMLVYLLPHPQHLSFNLVVQETVAKLFSISDQSIQPAFPFQLSSPTSTLFLWLASF